MDQSEYVSAAPRGAAEVRGDGETGEDKRPLAVALTDLEQAIDENDKAWEYAKAHLEPALAPVSSLPNETPPEQTKDRRESAPLVEHIETLTRRLRETSSDVDSTARYRLVV